MPKLTRMAISVDTPSIMAMRKGPSSLQIRSMRLICEFMTVDRASFSRCTSYHDTRAGRGLLPRNML